MPNVKQEIPVYRQNDEVLDKYFQILSTVYTVSDNKTLSRTMFYLESHRTHAEAADALTRQSQDTPYEEFTGNKLQPTVLDARTAYYNLNLSLRFG